jgi:hypothetical protein
VLSGKAATSSAFICLSITLFSRCQGAHAEQAGDEFLGTCSRPLRPSGKRKIVVGKSAWLQKLIQCPPLVQAAVDRAKNFVIIK